MFSLLFAKKPKASGLVFVTVSTLAYLVVEFAFNSRLLDVVGGLPSHDEIESIERFGRSISGFALALAFWPMLFARLEKKEPFKKAMVIGVVSIALIVSVYVFQKKLVESIVRNSSPEGRYSAVNLVALQNCLVTQDIELEGLPLPKERLAAPDGKAFLATFPILALSTSDLDRKIKKMKPDIIYGIVDRKYGGRTENFNRYVESLKVLQDTYNSKYVPGSNAYTKSINSIPEKQDNAWRKYENELKKFGQAPATVPQRYWDRVRGNVRSSGVPVGSDWRPFDRYTFDEAIEKRVRAETKKAYEGELNRHFPGQPGALPPGLSFAAFAKSRAIQAAWMEKLRYPAEITLSPDFKTEKEFYRAVYSKVLETTVQENMKKYDAPVEFFKDGEPLDDFGKDSVQIMVAAPMALVFSLTGAVVHLLKFAFFSIQVATGYAPRSGLVKTMLILGWVVVMFTAFNIGTRSHVTTQPLYHYFQEKTMCMVDNRPTIQGKMIAYAIRGTIHGQNTAYPIFEWTRKNMLMGFGFGYHGKTLKN